jgi:phosphatidylserine/phosphatidylglycerophosphate/cardiolipin synthase-like enzyme
MKLLLAGISGALGCLLAAMAALADDQVSLSSCFAPEDHCATFIASAIDQAKSDIKFGAYNFTIGPISDALLRAKQRGVDIKAIFDKTTPCERNGALDTLYRAGIPIWIDSKVRIAHQKIVIIDGRRTIEGSYNFSSNADHNSENTNLVVGSTTASAYATHWTRRQAVSAIYAGPQDWCKSAGKD